MTNEQKYTELLKEIACIIKQKNETIALQEWQLSNMKAKLESAENKISELKGVC